MRHIGHKVLAHGLQTLQARHITCNQQQSTLHIWHHVHAEHLPGHVVTGHINVARPIRRMQVADKIRLTQQMLHRQAKITLAQAKHLPRRRVKAQNPMVLIQRHDGIR